MPSSARFLGVLLLSLTSFNEAPTIASANLVSRQTPSSPTLTFKPTSNPVVACNSTTFSWDYSGPDLRMTLFVTNAGVKQLDPPSLPSPPTPSPTASVGAIPLRDTLSDIDGLEPTRDTSFTWETVQLPRGWYVLECELRAANYSSQGPPFFVEEYGNNTCLTTLEQAHHSATSTPSQGAPAPSQSQVVSSASSDRISIFSITIASIVALVGYGVS